MKQKQLGFVYQCPHCGLHGHWPGGQVTLDHYQYCVSHQGQCT